MRQTLSPAPTPARASPAAYRPLWAHRRPYVTVSSNNRKYCWSGERAARRRIISVSVAAARTSSIRDSSTGRRAEAGGGTGGGPRGHAAGSVTHSPAAAALRAAGGTRGAHFAGRVPSRAPARSVSLSLTLERLGEVDQRRLDLAAHDRIGDAGQEVVGVECRVETVEGDVAGGVHGPHALGDGHA